MELTKDNFTAETGEGLILVDFWAEWCGPCQGMMPVLAELEASGVKVGKVDVDTQSKYASEFGIRNIPTVLIFKDGKMVQRQVGVAPKSTYVNLINENL